jgi:enterochelin esterase-like enzyme
MNILNWSSLKKNRFFQHFFFRKAKKLEIHQWQNYHSRYLKRDVKLEVILPDVYYQEPDQPYPVLLLNDGQDVPALQLFDTLEALYARKILSPIIVVAIHAGNRMQEYGTAGQLDYQKRGKKAKAYTQFILKELIPDLHLRYRLSIHHEDWVIAGFSLGGLSAFDIAWKQPTTFGKVGVFSGSLWWRSKAFIPSDPDADRIIHDMVEAGVKKKDCNSGFKQEQQTNWTIEIIMALLML